MPGGPPGAGGELATTATTGGTLYVVATPIGNLGDVTLRALEVLRAVPLIACEDTRVTRRLLDRHGIEGRLVSYHAHSGPGRLEELLAHLRAGLDVALTTDAGTPGVSDPGEGLVAAWAAEAGPVVPVPGASAVLAAVAASGLAGPRWAFEGFLPRRGAERRERLARIGREDRATIIYEAANRLGPTLRDLGTACGSDRPAAVCRELTKLHEQIARGSLEELAAEVDAGRIPALGEVVVVVAARPADDVGEPPSAGVLDAALAEVDRRIAAGLGRSEAARAVSASTGIPRRQLYGGSRTVRGRSAPPG
ncbi:MAG TPA: 16S rRNA (cytidine(1402)-2'-O)-methyltransferase [Candidatus Limnocylindrales bacterium]|nr:16S rRNA (cytidine(1402)-2'-O)-methyltransferase [Candidatus Limnocylindrales bacterium]